MRTMHLPGFKATGLLSLLAALFLLSLGSGGGPVAGDVASDELPRVAEPALRTRPVLLIPGFASSQLHAWKRVTCGHSIQKNLYRDVNVGDRIWIDVARILAQGDCWVRCMKLHIANQSEIDCKLRAADGMAAVSELDPGLVTGPLSTIWGTLIRDLIDSFGLGPDELIVAPYDWRLPPAKMQQRDKYFSALKRKIEYTVTLHGATSGIVVIAHSMGNSVFRYFLEWLKLELGRNHWQPWIDRHISTYFAVGSPLLGSSEALELLSSGVTQGLPLSQREVRKLVVTFGSIISFLPLPSGRNSSHDGDTLLHVRMATGATGSTKREDKSYTSAEIASGEFFRDMAPHDPLFGDLEQVRKRFYEDDDVLDALVPWTRPPIANVYSVYGVNQPTKHSYKYQSTDTAGHWYQLALENEDSSRQSCSKTGDGTVPYHSLSWAHTWLDSHDSDAVDADAAVVNVTQVPQSVYFSDQSVRSFQARRDTTARHHAEYQLHGRDQPMCSPADDIQSSRSTATNSAASITPRFLEGFFKSSTLDQITFFERRDDETDSSSAAKRTTGVWEIDGAGHREILGHPAFLRELRAEMRNLFAGHTRSDKTSRPPVIDSDCYWNYRRAQCAFTDFCEYRYSFGDVTLDQSCRLRAFPKRRAAPARPPLVDKTKTVAVDVGGVVLPPTTSKSLTPPRLDFSRPFCSAPCPSPTSSAATRARTAALAVMTAMAHVQPLASCPDDEACAAAEEATP